MGFCKKCLVILVGSHDVLGFTRFYIVLVLAFVAFQGKFGCFVGVSVLNPGFLGLEFIWGIRLRV